MKLNESLPYIYCVIRKKWLLLTPEEWVRQHTVKYLIQEKKYSQTAINTEVVVDINGLQKRADIVVFKKEKPFLIVECKAPSVSITQATFDQIARYNMTLHADFLMVTNGMLHYYCQMDYDNQQYHFLKELPQATH